MNVVYGDNCVFRNCNLNGFYVRKWHTYNDYKTTYNIKPTLRLSIK